MIRSASIALAMSVTCAAHADPKIGDTLACTSKDPAKRLYAVVGRIEPFGKDRSAAQITLINETPGAAPGQAAHIPIDLTVLGSSCPKLADTPRKLNPNFAAGRQQWIEARGGVFTIPVDEIDEILHDQIARAKATNREPAP